MRIFPVHGWMLKGVALQVAREMFELFPDAEITSGGRSISEQARAMARNEKRKPGWIQKTYRDTEIKRACVKWCAQNRGVNEMKIFDALKKILDGFAAKGIYISKHFSGLAFDVRPNGDLKLKAWLLEQATNHGGLFLDKEGDLEIWHWQA